MKRGDVYQSNDPREKGRKVRLVADLGTHYVVENVRTRRRTKIRKDYLGSTKRTGFTKVAQ